MIRSQAKKLIGFNTMSRFLSYDPETGVLTWNYVEPITKRDKFHNSIRAGKSITSIAKDGYNYLTLQLDGVNLYTGAHHAAFLLKTGYWLQDDLEIDHENTIRSDNRWVNFRFTDRRGNGKNRSMSVLNSTGYKGVYAHQTKPGWFISKIVVDYKQHYLGEYPTAQEAASAYDKAATRFHGEFARTNTTMGVL